MPDVFADPSTINGAEKLPPHRFSLRPKIDKAKSAEAGHPVFEDAPYIEVFIDSTSGISRHATPADLQRFGASYAQFQRDITSEGIVGLRLEEWPPMTRSLVEEFRYHKIRTVEHLADLSDARCSEMPQGREWREKARAWLTAAKDGAPVARIAAENQKLKDELSAMKRQMDEAMKQIDRLTDPKAKRG